MRIQFFANSYRWLTQPSCEGFIGLKALLKPEKLRVAFIANSESFRFPTTHARLVIKQKKVNYIEKRQRKLRFRMNAVMAWHKSNSGLEQLLCRIRWCTRQNKQFLLFVSVNAVASRSERCWPCSSVLGEAAQTAPCSLYARWNPQNSAGMLFETSQKGHQKCHSSFLRGVDLITNFKTYASLLEVEILHSYIFASVVSKTTPFQWQWSPIFRTKRSFKWRSCCVNHIMSWYLQPWPCT